MHGLAPGRPRRSTASGSPSSSASSSGMKYPGYFLIVADFIQWAKAQGIPVGPGPRLGRRLAGRLCAHHHRSRSDALRSPVRALPQSRARLDAGFRHRLLPGPARRGDPTTCRSATAATGWRRSSPSAPCRRAACCATSAACCRCPMGRSTGSASWCRRIPRNPVTLERAIDDEPRLQAERDRDPVVRARLRHRAEAGRAAPPRLDPCRRHRHRRAAADRAGAALPRSEIR